MTQRPYRSLALIAVTTLTLGGCMPHLTQDQCQLTDWRQMGYQDASRGQLPRDLSRDIQDCAQFKLPVNTKAYQRGWRAGTRQFCKSNTAFNIGVEGQTYNHICPDNLAGPFEASYRRGLRRYCIPSTGYELGRTGKSLPNFCATNLRVAFNNAYRRGYRIYAQIQNLKGQVTAINNQISDDQSSINHNNDAINQAQATHDRHTIHNAKRDNRDRQDDLDRLTDEKEGLQQQISTIQGNTD